MKRAFLDILLSTVAVLLSLFLAHFLMRQNGLSRPIPESTPGWWTGKFIISQEYNATDFSPATIANLEKIYGNLKIEIVPQITITEKNQQAGLKLVTELLRSTKFNILLNVLAYKFQIDKEVIRTVALEKGDARVIVRSAYDNIVREISRQRPKWNVSAGEGETSRLYILSALALESFPPLTGGFYFFNLNRNPYDFSSRVLAELRRRQMIVIVETPDDASAWERALVEGVNGIVTPSAEKFLQWYKDHSL